MFLFMTGQTLHSHKIASYLGNAYTKIQASRFDPRMIEQLKVTMGTQTALLKSIAQVAARTQISYSITPFDPAVGLKNRWDL